ncbi:hypothetical protein IWX92DRAFT_116117 [Phyllosticta citricarpa]
MSKFSRVVVVVVCIKYKTKDVRDIHLPGPFSFLFPFSFPSLFPGFGMTSSLRFVSRVSFLFTRAMSYTPFPPLFPSLSHHSPHLPSSIRSVLVIRTRILHPLCLLLDAILILDNPAAQPFQQARRGLRRRPRTTLALANDNGTAAAPLGAARLGLGALGFGDAVRGPRAQLAPLPRAPPPLQLVVDLAAAPRAARPLPERRRFRAAPDAAAAVATAARRSRVALGTRAHGGGAGHCAREAGVGSAEALGFVGGEVVVPRRRRSRRRGRGRGPARVLLRGSSGGGARRGRTRGGL